MTAIQELLQAVSELDDFIDRTYPTHDDLVGAWYEDYVNPKLLELSAKLDRFRCTCGKLPVEGSLHGYWCVRCCGIEWDCWEDFLEWRATNDRDPRTGE